MLASAACCYIYPGVFEHLHPNAYFLLRRVLRSDFLLRRRRREAAKKQIPVS
jgi:hypothetical protein